MNGGKITGKGKGVYGEIGNFEMNGGEIDELESIISNFLST